MWNPNGATFANKDVVGEFPRTIFVDIYNTVYVAAYKNDELLFWPEGSTSSVKLSGVKLAEYGSMFVTIDGDVYFEKDGEQGKIYKWSKNTTTTVLVKEFEELCYSLFIDIDNTLYCSVHNGAKVLATSLNDNQSDLTIVAGTGSTGLSSDETYKILVEYLLILTLICMLRIQVMAGFSFFDLEKRMQQQWQDMVLHRI